MCVGFAQFHSLCCDVMSMRVRSLEDLGVMTAEICVLSCDEPWQAHNDELADVREVCGTAKLCAGGGGGVCVSLAVSWLTISCHTTPSPRVRKIP